MTKVSSRVHTPWQVAKQITSTCTCKADFIVVTAGYKAATQMQGERRESPTRTAFGVAPVDQGFMQKSSTHAMAALRCSNDANDGESVW